MTTSNKPASRSFSVLAISLLSVVLAGFCSSTANAFRPLTLLPSLTQVSAPVQKSMTVLWSSNSVDEDDDNFLVQFDSAENTKKPRDDKEVSSNLWKQVQVVNDKFWDYTCNFLYIAISCLILLNFCGFGYTISAKEGLNIMPIQEYRQERQWKEELNKQRPLVAPASALQTAPAAFLLHQNQK